jgi:hypothetical protein
MGIQNGITVGTGCRAVRCLSEETSVGGGHGAAVGELEMEGAVVAWMTVQGPSNMKKWLLAPVSAIVWVVVGLLGGEDLVGREEWLI